MGTTSSIQWTDATWNIARGCSKVDEDCKFCYMFRDSLRATRYIPNQVVKTKTVFDLPLRLKTPSKIFTSSLTDFFHEDCDSFRQDAWDIIRKCPQHTFQILTKRPERISRRTLPSWKEGNMRVMANNLDNVWMGTSVGSQASMDRVYKLVHSLWSGTKFLSLEPLHGPIDLRAHVCPKCQNPTFYHGIDWVIVGGESGNENGLYRYRECKIEWIESIINQCHEIGVPVFVKQLGTHLAKEMKLSDRHGGKMEEWPANLQIRQFPTV